MLWTFSIVLGISAQPTCLHMGVSPAAPQVCAVSDCADVAAYRSRTKPAFCAQHVTKHFHDGGLTLLAPADKPSAWVLTRCLECDVVAHYRYAYVADNNSHGTKTCRACFWRAWARQAREHQPSYPAHDPSPVDVARAGAEEAGFDYLGPLTDPVLPHDPHHVRCRSCQRISAQRLADIAFGCSCLNSSRRTTATKPAGGRALLADSGLAAVDWGDHEMNPAASWATAIPGSRADAHWKCPLCGNEFVDSISEMAKRVSCPQCVRVENITREEERAWLFERSVLDVPRLSAAWADNTDPRLVAAAGDPTARLFRCTQGHVARTAPETYYWHGCPSCRGNATRSARQQQVTLDSELVTQWHPTENEIPISKVADTSNRRIWWRDTQCGHTWVETPRERHKRPRWRCPECKTRLGSLAWHYPELAEQWGSTNPTTPWHVLPTGKTHFLPTWVCPVDPTHLWQSTVAARVSGAECPQCRVSGKSRVELSYWEAAVDRFGQASSGAVVRDERFTRRSSWTPDITLRYEDVPVAIEYDGAYWHAEKTQLDCDKTSDLLAAGYIVVRLREDALPFLDVPTDHCLQLRVYSTGPRPEEVMAAVHDWLRRITE